MERLRELMQQITDKIVELAAVTQIEESQAGKQLKQ
jgi:hypothetical protein